MTIPPFYEPVMLRMPLEAYAQSAVIGGIWLAGELLAQRVQEIDALSPDPAYIHMPRHRTAALALLRELNQTRRLGMFVAGFLALPYNGAQGTFRRLLVTNTEMLNEALGAEWSRCLERSEGREGTVDSIQAVANELLHKLCLAR